MRYLCDTNILSELARPRPNPGVLRWATSVARVSLSAITLEEIQFGLAWHPNPRVIAWFESFLSDHCELVPVTAEVARVSGHLRGQLRADGKSRTQADMLIAATASVFGLTMVTRNARDFEGCGIALLNPFS